MPLPNPNYVPMFPLQEQLWDKNLNVPLAAGYILFFQDVARTIPKDVFIQTQSPGPTYSYTDIGSQVTLSSIGTTQYLGTDSIIFLYPYDATGLPQLYYIEVFSSDNRLQFTRSGWPPLGVSSGSSGASGFSQSSNIISNPQFARVLFDAQLGATFNVMGTMTTEIAPDWSLITTGTGTVTVNQIGITDEFAPGEPAYALDISSTGIDTLILNQIISDSPRILENNFASGTFIIEAIAPTVSTIVTMNYVPSLGSSIPIATGIASAGSFSSVSGTTSAVIPQTNTQAPSPFGNGYVNIQLEIQVGVHIQISCIQLVSVLNAATRAAYVQESVPRQIDHLFHYYQPQLNFKPISSLLVGWDFALNPAQFGSTQTLSSGTLAYIWDQTIGARTVGNVGISRSSSPKGFFAATTTVANEVFYIMQYLSDGQAAETALSRLSVNLSAYATNANVIAQVFLCNGNNSSAIPLISVGSIGTIDTSGVFTVTSANWLPIIQPDKESHKATLNTSIDDYGFNGFDPTAFYGLTSNFAIVVTFVVPTSGTVIIIDSISCVPGDIPTRPAPQTADQVLRECQYYWRSSFPVGTVPANNIGFANTGPSFGIQSIAGINSNNGPIIRFSSPMRVAPGATVILYNPSSGTAGQIYNPDTTGSYSGTSALNISANGFTTIGTANSGSLVGDFQSIHWVANSQLGIV